MMIPGLLGGGGVGGWSSLGAHGYPAPRSPHRAARAACQVAAAQAAWTFGQTQPAAVV